MTRDVTRSPADRAGVDLLQQVLAGDVTSYALLRRCTPDGEADRLEVLAGPTSSVAGLDDLPMPSSPGPGAPGGGSGEGLHHVLAFIPYRQLRERGYACRDDGEPVLTLPVDRQASLPLGTALDLLAQAGDRGVGAADGVRDIRFEPDDDTYGRMVERVVSDEIGAGEGANFVIHRTVHAQLDGPFPAAALAAFYRLLVGERGSYWVFLVRTPGRTFVGASPERHVALRDGELSMNPISGTLRFAPSGPDVPSALRFLADRKETDELSMVVDEELKMMARLCDAGIVVQGPALRQMSRLAHTEYELRGRCTLDVRHVLRETMFAPTVTGSPLENAARVIARHEPAGRGYYSGVAALISVDAAGRTVLDSAILIRCGQIDDDGHVRIGVGSTLVRLSDPASEAAETRAKAAGLLAAFGAPTPAPPSAPAAGSGTAVRSGSKASDVERMPGLPIDLAGAPEVRSALRSRNTRLSRFWLGGGRPSVTAALAERSVLVVDAEDRFTAMIAYQLRACGMHVRVVSYRDSVDPDDADLVVVGPGPGDPRDRHHPKIAAMVELTERLLLERRPFFSVCLGHQVLATVCGLPVRRRDTPRQGTQAEVEVAGRRRLVGFYNSFAAVSQNDSILLPGRFGSARQSPGQLQACVHVDRDPRTGEVHALRGERFASVQFHLESLLTQDGPGLLGDLLPPLLDGDRADLLVADRAAVRA